MVPVHRYIGESFGADEKAAEMIALAIEKAHPVEVTVIGGNVVYQRE